MSELPLPWFGPGLDPGPSFTELLRRVTPEVLPEHVISGEWRSGTTVNAPHGTTILAVRYVDGVVMAGDRRATEGHAIAGRTMEKVQQADSHSGVAIAGAAGPAMEMVRLFQTELEHYEKVEGESLSLEGKANRLAQMVRANLPAAMQGLVVVPVFAGFDRQRDRGRLFKYDVTGGRYEETDYFATGSGGVHARNWIKASWTEGLSRDAAVALSLRALFHAADEDSATGGPDLIRGIFPTVATIDASGFAAMPDDEVAQRSREHLGGQP